MKITLLLIGKTEDAYLREGISKYLNRLRHYARIDFVEIPELKNTKALTEEQQKVKEAELMLKKLLPADHVILLDEKGVREAARLLKDPHWAYVYDIVKDIKKVTNALDLSTLVESVHESFPEYMLKTPAAMEGDRNASGQ